MATKRRSVLKEKPGSPRMSSSQVWSGDVRTTLRKAQRLFLQAKNKGIQPGLMAFWAKPSSVPFDAVADAALRAKRAEEEASGSVLDKKRTKAIAFRTAKVFSRWYR